MTGSLSLREFPDDVIHHVQQVRARGAIPKGSAGRALRRRHAIVGPPARDRQVWHDACGVHFVGLTDYPRTQWQPDQ